MLRQIHSLVSIATLVLLPVWAAAETDTQTAEALMHKSGLWQQLADVAPQIVASTRSAIEQEGERVTPSEADRVIASAETAYAVDRLRSAVRARIVSGLDSAKVAALLTWYDGAIGIAVTRAEEAGSADLREPEARLREDAKLLAQLPAARRELLQKIVDVSRGAEVAATVAIRTAVASQRAVESTRPGVPAVPSEDLEAALEQQRSRMERMYGAIMQASSARIYASLPDASLTRYIDFLGSAAGSHFTMVASQALEAALVAAAEDFARALPGTRDQLNT